MDIGSTVCTPRAPDCQNCPVQHYCISYAKGTPESYPVRAVKSPVPHKHIATAFIRDASDAVLLAQRPAHGLLGGLWELPGVEFIMDPYPGAANEYDAASAHLAAYIHRVSGLHIQVSADDFMGTVKHAFTHFRITRHVAIATLTLTAPKVQPNAAYTNLRWVKPDEVRDLALTRSDHKIIELVKTTVSQ